jgi:hypothetical protein
MQLKDMKLLALASLLGTIGLVETRPYIMWGETTRDMGTGLIGKL